MGNIKNLTKDQKKKLKVLEPMLQKASGARDYEKAKRITLEIQRLLRPTGHVTRLMQSKNRLFETAMECGKLETAIRGFLGVRQNVSRNTRLFLEATSLLAICFLRKQDIQSARPYMNEALKCEKNIKSETFRTRFKVNLAKRFNEEALLASLATETANTLDPAKIQEDAGKLIQENSEDEILELLGSTVPSRALEFVEVVHKESLKLLTYKERKMLPPPVTFKEKRKLGKGVISAFQNIAWRALCDKESDIFQMWISHGIQAVLDKNYITAIIVATLSGIQIGVYAVAVYLSALIIKMGIKTFCESYQPKNLMDLRKK